MKKKRRKEEKKKRRKEEEKKRRKEEKKKSVTVPGVYLQLSGDDSTSTLNLRRKRKDKRCGELLGSLIPEVARAWC